MNQAIPERNDPSRVCDLGAQLRELAQRLRQRLSDDPKLALDRRTQKKILRLLFSMFALEESKDGFRRLEHFPEIGLAVTQRHTP